MTNPIIVSLNPENTFADVLTNTALVITYDEPVIAGSSGSLTIRKTSDNSVVETVTLPSAQVSASNSAGIVKLSALLDAGTSYHVDVDAGFFTDAATNPAPAISGATEWAFTTRGAPEVLISQYYEGAGTDRYIELKNLTSSPLSLDGYSVTAWSNSDPAGREGWKSGVNSTTRITDLTGQTIPANGTFLIAETAAAAPPYAVANNDLRDDGGCTAINGDDSVVLYFSGVDPLGFTLAEVVDAISIAGTEGTNRSFYRLTDGPGFDFAPGSSILDFAAVWGTKTNAEVDAAADTDEWYLKASKSIEALTLSLSPSSVTESAGLAASVATVTRSGSTSGAVFVTVASSNPTAAAEEGLAGFVEIPDGQASASFNIDVTDNPWRVGDASVTFSVSAEGLLPDSADLTILDDTTDVPLPLVINEVDANTPGTDVDEFVEIYNNSSEEVSLDGLVLVLFNGSGDSSYNTVDLSGYSIPGNGFFVIGSASVPNVDLEAFSSNGIQNGADAVALYYGRAADFPNGTPASNSRGVLLDALVYANNIGDDPGLLDALTPGQVQVNESINAASESESMSRASDGGAAFDSSLYIAQTPTPGATNVLPTATFASWAAGNGIAGEPFDGDFDGDGISNGLEYAIGGLDPALPDAAPGSFAAGVLSFTKRAEAVANGDVSWQIEESTDLGITDPWAAVTPDTDDESTISYTLPSGLGKVFARLKVTQSAP
ncbi:MAG: lamin tail domain-containing protein [Luteolibacter sp.]